GLVAGMTLTEARALCPGLVARTLGPGEEARALERLAAWAVRGGPNVGAVPGAEGRPPGVAGEGGGPAHPFGGGAPLPRRAVEALARAGTGATAAIAGTLGAAYALAARAARALTAACPVAAPAVQESKSLDAGTAGSSPAIVLEGGEPEALAGL